MLTIGVDLGGTKCLGVVLDDAGVVVDEARLATPVGDDAVLGVLTRVAETLVDRSGGVDAVGVGVPGLVDERGRLRFAPNLPGVVEVEVGAVLTDRLGLPVVVENDASCAGWGERCVGAASGLDHVVLVTLGTGIGGGLVLGGRLYHGSNGFAGEIGHMVVDRDGPPCPCGQRGCWERYASGTGLAWLAGGRKGEEITAAASEGDSDAIDVMRRFGWWVALGLSNLASVFDPQAFVLGGGLVEAGDVLFTPVRSAFQSLLEGAEHRPPIAILPAALGERAGAIGAALLARDLA